MADIAILGIFPNPPDVSVGPDRGDVDIWITGQVPESGIACYPTQYRINGPLAAADAVDAVGQDGWTWDAGDDAADDRPAKGGGYLQSDAETHLQVDQWLWDEEPHDEWVLAQDDSQVRRADASTSLAGSDEPLEDQFVEDLSWWDADYQATQPVQAQAPPDDSWSFEEPDPEYWKTGGYQQTENAQDFIYVDDLFESDEVEDVSWWSTDCIAAVAAADQPIEQHPLDEGQPEDVSWWTNDVRPADVVVSTDPIVDSAWGFEETEPEFWKTGGFQQSDSAVEPIAYTDPAWDWEETPPDDETPWPQEARGANVFGSTEQILETAWVWDEEYADFWKTGGYQNSDGQAVGGDIEREETYFDEAPTWDWTETVPSSYQQQDAEDPIWSDAWPDEEPDNETVWWTDNYALVEPAPTPVGPEDPWLWDEQPEEPAPAPEPFTPGDVVPPSDQPPADAWDWSEEPDDEKWIDDYAVVDTAAAPQCPDDQWLWDEEPEYEWTAELGAHAFVDYIPPPSQFVPDDWEWVETPPDDEAWWSTHYTLTDAPPPPPDTGAPWHPGRKRHPRAPKKYTVDDANKRAEEQRLAIERDNEEILELVIAIWTSGVLDEIG